MTDRTEGSSQAVQFTLQWEVNKPGWEQFKSPGPGRLVLGRQEGRKGSKGRGPE